MKRHQRSLEIEVIKRLSLQYLLYLPERYDAESTKKWPLILFLHGMGECGDDLKMVENHGPPMLIAQKKRIFLLLSYPPSVQRT